MNTKTKLSALLLAAVLAVAPLSGCTEKDADNGDGNTAMGRYVEESWDLPVDAVYLRGLHRRPDGRVAMLLNTDEGGQMYYSTSDGTDWQQETPDWLTKLQEHTETIEALHFNSKGEGTATYYETGDETYSSKVAYISADGSLRVTPIGENGNPFRDEAYYERMQAMSDAMADNESEEDVEDGGGETGEALRAEGTVTPAQEGEAESEGEETLSDEISDDDESQSGVQSVYTIGNNFYLTSLYMGEDGFIYIDIYGDVGRFDPETGEMVQAYLQGSLASTMAGGQVVQLMNPESAGYYNQVQPDENTIYFMGDDGKPVTEQPATVMSSSRNPSLFGDTDGSLYLADMDGLYRLAPGGESWEQVIDGALSNLSMPSSYVYGMVIHGDNEFLFSYYTNGGGIQLINCVYSPDTPTLPDTELTVYSLLNNYTLNQAVGVFRKKYPNVLVNIRTPNDGDGAMSGDEAIRALNTELLAGKGPDLFLLDNMPIDSYIEKEVLLDLADIIQPLIDSGELYANIAGTLERDGGIYGVPTRIVIPTLWGGKEAVAAANSLQALADWADENPAFYNAQRDRMLFGFVRANQNHFIGGDGQIDVDALASFLTLMDRILPEKQEEVEPEGESVAARIAVSAQMDGFFDEEDYFDFDSLFGVVNGTSDLVTGNLTGFSSAMSPNGAVFARYGGVISYDAETGVETTSLPDDEVADTFRHLPTLGGNAYYPVGIIGVNAAGQQVDLAKEFVLAILGEETQNIELYNGFPVNAKAMEKRLLEEMPIASVNSYFDEETGTYQMLEMGYPSLGARQAIAGLIESLDTPVLANQSLLELIIYESQSFFEGDRTAQEAAQAVADGTRLQMEE